MKNKSVSFHDEIQKHQEPHLVLLTHLPTRAAIPMEPQVHEFAVQSWKVRLLASTWEKFDFLPKVRLLAISNEKHDFDGSRLNFGGPF